MEILDIIALVCAIIATGLSFETSRLLRSTPLQIITFACLYGVVIRSLVVLNYNNVIDCTASTSASLAAIFWIILVIGLAALYRTIKHMLDKK